MEHIIKYSIIANFVNGFVPTKIMFKKFKWSEKFTPYFEELAQLVSYLDVKLPLENEMTFECHGFENQLLAFQNALHEIISNLNSKIQQHFMAGNSIKYVELILVEKSITCTFCNETREANLIQLSNHVKDKHLHIMVDY